MSGPPTWAEFIVMVAVCSSAVSDAVYAKHEHGGGRAFACQVGCTERGGLCYCNVPATVLTPPAWSPCPSGCYQEDGFCWCLEPALYRESGSPQFTCPLSCKLQYQSCLCPTPVGPPQTVLPPAKTPGYPPTPSYSCQPGCVADNNQCVCASDPRIVLVPGKPSYLCHESCILQNEICVCIDTATQSPPPVPVPTRKTRHRHRHRKQKKKKKKKKKNCCTDADKQRDSCNPQKKFYVREGWMTWFEAKSRCESEGKILASVLCEPETKELTKTILSDKKPKHTHWLGGRRTGPHDSDWMWISTGKALTYFNWDYDQPDNWYGREFCLLVRRSGRERRWNDMSCDRMVDEDYDAADGYICEDLRPNCEECSTST